MPTKYTPFFLAFVLIGAPLLYLIFPTNTAFENFISLFVFLVFIPFFAFRFIFKTPLTFLILNKARWKKDALLTLGFFTLLGIFHGFLFSFFPQYTNFYPSSEIISQNFSAFLLFILITASMLFMYEFFFRGILLSFLRAVFGIFGIPLQALLFFFFLFFAVPNILFAVFLGMLSLVSGFLAYTTKTIWYSFSFSLAFVILIYILALN